MWFWSALGLNTGAGRGERLREGQAGGAAAAKERATASDGLGPSGEEKKKKKKKKNKKKNKKKIRQQQQQQHTTTKESDGQKVRDVTGVEVEPTKAPRALSDVQNAEDNKRAHAGGKKRAATTSTPSLCLPSDDLYRSPNGVNRNKKPRFVNSKNASAQSANGHVAEAASSQSAAQDPFPLAKDLGISSPPQVISRGTRSNSLWSTSSASSFTSPPRGEGRPALAKSPVERDKRRRAAVKRKTALLREQEKEARVSEPLHARDYSRNSFSRVRGEAFGRVLSSRKIPEGSSDQIRKETSWTSNVSHKNLRKKAPTPLKPLLASSSRTSKPLEATSKRGKLQRGDLESFGTSLSQESPVIDLCESSDAESDDDKGRLCNAKKAQKKSKATMSRAAWSHAQLLPLHHPSSALRGPCGERISPADIKRINAALSSSKDQNRVLAAMGSTKITRRDLQCLRDGEWLNDEVINFFLATVQERVRRKRQLWYGRRAGDDDTKILNTHFFTKLSNRRTDDPNERLTYSYENVRRWIKFELADYDRIVVPLHEGNHWRTAVIDLARKRIVCYDSLLQAQFGIRGLKFLARWVRDLYAEAYAQDLSLSDWSLELAKTAPQQSNTVDCGVFACMFAVTAGYNLPIKYGARDMAFFRRRILLDILDWGKEKTGVQARA